MIGSNVSATSQNLVTSNSFGSAKPTSLDIGSPQTINTSLSIAFGDTGQARHIEPSNTVLSLPTAASSPKQSTNQHVENLTPPRFVRSPQTGPCNSVASSKVSPLPTLRPKGITPLPQNLLTSVGQNTSQKIRIQGNVVTQAQLVSIRPKIVIAQSNAGGPTGQMNSTADHKQVLQNTFALGAKGQQQLPKQVNINTMTHLTQTLPNQPVSKPGLTNLIQLQPKQIAPKPEQVPTLQTPKAKLDQSQLQLVQSLLGTQQAQFAQKSTTQGPSQENLTQQQQQRIAQQNQLKSLIHQNQLVQQALQIRAKQQLQQQSTQQQQATPQQQQFTQSQQQTTQQQHVQQQPTQQQKLSLHQMKTTPSNAPSSSIPSLQPAKLPIPATINAVNLAAQLREAINNKQLHQFLEKNPIVAQQLKQLNMRQASLASNREQGVIAGNTSTSVKSVSQLQKPTIGQVQKGIVAQSQNAGTVGQKPSLTIGQYQKGTVINQLSKPTTNISVRTAPNLPKFSTSNVTRSAETHVTASNTKKIVSVSSTGNITIPATGQVKHITIPSGGQSTIAQKSDQKPVTTQKVVIVQNSNAISTVQSAGQPKVLLQTKEGRPILLSQEQFRQIQAQLASKNLSIQGKLVTTAQVTTTTATTVKPQVTVKSEASTPKVTSPHAPNLIQLDLTSSATFGDASSQTSNL